MFDKLTFIGFVIAGLLIGVATLPYHGRWLSRSSCGSWYEYLMLSMIAWPITVLFGIRSYYLAWRDYLGGAK